MLSLFSLPPSAAPLSAAKEDKKSEVTLTPLKEKPTTRRSETSLVIMLCTYLVAKQNLRDLAKKFPNSSQDPLGFAKEFNLTIKSCKARLSDLYHLRQLLVSEAKQGNEERKQDRNVANAP